MGKITVQNETIEYREREMKVDDLKFWPENPRVYSALRLKLMGEEPSQKDIEEVENDTKSFDGLTLNLAINYGGRDELVRSVRKIVDSKINSKSITEENGKVYDAWMLSFLPE